MPGVGMRLTVGQGDGLESQRLEPASPESPRLAKAVFEVLVVEFSDHFDGASVAHDGDGGEGDSVEGRVFDHGVVGHVVEDDLVANLELAVEGIVADDVSTEAGGAPEAVAVFFFAGLAGSFDVGTVGHF